MITYFAHKSATWVGLSGDSLFLLHIFSDGATCLEGKELTRWTQGILKYILLASMVGELVQAVSGELSWGCRPGLSLDAWASFQSCG